MHEIDRREKPERHLTGGEGGKEGLHVSVRKWPLAPHLKVKVKVYQFQKAEAANRNTQNKFLCFAVCPPVVLVLGRPVKQWSSCGIGGHAVCRLLCILVYV